LYRRVDFFFIDTSPFILRYYDKQNTWAHCTGGLLTQHWQDQLVVLEAALAASAAEWKVGAGCCTAAKALQAAVSPRLRLLSHLGAGRLVRQLAARAG
jgi:hypothetical protein